MLIGQLLTPHPNPIPLVSLYGERQAFALGEGRFGELISLCALILAPMRFRGDDNM